MKRHNNAIKHQAVAAYSKGNTLAAISKQLNISPNTIYNWVKHSSHETHGRGRRQLSSPSERDRHILRAAETQSVSSIAEQFNISRQRVHAILKHWGFDRSSVNTPTMGEAKNPIVELCGQLDSRENRDVVITFRITPSQASKLQQGLEPQPGRSRFSISKAARQIVLGAIEWKNPCC